MSNDAIQILERELGPLWHEETINGMRLKDVVLKPAEEVLVVDCFGSGESLPMWLILADHPGTHEGLAVAYDPVSRGFFLVEHDSDESLIVLGRHPSFVAAVKAM